VTVIFIEIVHWQDPRLNYSKYTNISSISAYHKSHWIDLQTSNDLIWKPTHSYVNQVLMEVESEQVYLYSNGEIDWLRKVALTVKCNFDFSLYPNDHQECSVIPYITRYQTN
jgi:Neurotransmitter-gated ion-channel ligand binding domain